MSIFTIFNMVYIVQTDHLPKINHKFRKKSVWVVDSRVADGQHVINEHWGSGLAYSAEPTKGTSYQPNAERLLKRSMAGFGSVGDLPRKTVRTIPSCAPSWTVFVMI